MNIFLHELKSYRRSTIVWAISLSAIAILFLLMYPAFTKDVVASKNILAHFPQTLREAVGLSLTNFFTIAGFYAYLMTYVLLAGSIQAMNLGVGVISKEESGKTAEFLLTKPVSRQAVITSKLLAAVCLLVMTNIIFIVVSLVMARIVSRDIYSIKTFVLIAATLFLIQIAFVAIGALFAVLIPKIKSVITVTLPTVFAFFIIGTLGAILGNDNIRYISPFKYYDTSFIINHSAMETKFLIIELLIVVIALMISYLIFMKKDIRAVA